MQLAASPSFRRPGGSASRARWFPAAFRGLLLALLALAAPACLAPVARAETPVANWQGAWNTKWRGGGALIEFQQNGAEVTGTYPLYDGTIVAHAQGNELTGRWTQNGRSGDFLFVQAPDGQSFMGRLATGQAEWWTGVRMDAAAFTAIRIDRTSPMMALRSFLQAMNESGADGVTRGAGGGMALVGRAEGTVLVDAQARQGLDMPGYVRLLYDVIDRTTFRLWDVPHDTGDSDAVAVTLHQFGTAASFDLGFVRQRGQWFMVGQPTDALRRKLAEFDAARGLGRDPVRDPSRLSSPRDTFKVLLGALSEDFNAPPESTLDMRNYNPAVREDEAALLARYLKKVLDRIGYVYWQEIPDDPRAKAAFVYFEHPAGNIVIGPSEVEGATVWRFTPETLSHVRDLYADIEDMPVAPEFAAFASDDPYFVARTVARQLDPRLLARIGPIERWQWWLLAFALFAGVLVGFLSNALLQWLLLSLRGNNPAARFVRIVAWSVRLIFLGLFLIIALRPLGLPDIIGAPVKAFAWACIVVGAVPVLWQIVGDIADRYRRRHNLVGYHETLISLVSGVGRVIVVLIGFLMLAEVLHVPYEGVITGLGIGGLAVALAAQPTLQNFLSGLTLYADRPVSVGDECRFGEHIGTVEHIGMRSTHIRSRDRSLIAVPNSDFAGMVLENITRSDRMRYHTVLKLRQETSIDQLRFVLVEIRKLLLAHPKVAHDPCWVRFVGFGDFSFDIDIDATLLTTHEHEQLAIQEDLNLRILGILADCGVQLALPAELGYGAEDLPLDAEKRAAAEREVQLWRAEGNLPFPELHRSDITSLADTLAYPPEGSAAYRPVEEGTAPAALDGKRERWRLRWRSRRSTA
ncbi:mechanosensitive ion channel family protein [Ancylobacter lacus]|uniref:mechanosensitive ion channel family protein n=1 Tax=Ancylobacter lacus TaxID=2579970 RepID=UPI001BD020D9|nr:mechanosensitive ion channel family protein [Ancylobacter lacus]MBS7537678.1 mechanosensitive ion channel family protein [Ancylobacter lacus]